MTLVSHRPPRLSGPDLAERRRDCEVTQQQVADRLSVNRSRVAHIEAAAAPSRRAIRLYLAALADLEADR